MTRGAALAGGIAALATREWRRFYRQRGRVSGTLGTPIVLWGLLGAGFGGSVAVGEDGTGYLAYFFPGALVLQVLFTSVFANIGIVEDRRQGFLRGVLIAPMPGWAVAAGQVIGGSVIATVQGVIMLAAVPFLGETGDLAAWAGMVAMIVLLSVGFNALGCAAAWGMRSTQGFHAFMNLVLIPLWMVSTAVFPVDGAPGWLRSVMAANPLSYAIDGFRVLMGQAPGLRAPLSAHFGVTAVFAAAAFLAAAARAGRDR